MALSISRANLPGSGAPKVTFDGATLWTRDDVVIPLTENLVDRVASMYGRVGKNRGPRKIEFDLPLYGFWDNLAVLFPSYFMNYVHGARLFGVADKPFELLARNGDKLTLHNVRLTGMANLKLAANQPIFSGTARFTALIANNKAPTNAAAFYTFLSGQSYTEGDFPRNTYKSLAWTANWGSRANFQGIMTQDGWDVNWQMATEDDVVDGIGPVDQFASDAWASASCIPVGPAPADITGAANLQNANANVGADVGGDVDNLVLTDGVSTVTLYKAALVGHEFVFAPFRKRSGTLSFEVGTRAFSAGAPTALAAVT